MIAMTNIVQFPGRRVREVAVDDGFNTVRTPDTKVTAIGAVKALRFYANGGTDGGAIAQRVLQDMALVVNAAND